jgi:hypothetical protein
VRPDWLVLSHSGALRFDGARRSREPMQWAVWPRCNPDAITRRADAALGLRCPRAGVNRVVVGHDALTTGKSRRSSARSVVAVRQLR